MTNRKSAKNVRISPHLTLSRNKLLAEAINYTNENIDRENWGFVFANEHGDLLFRLSEKFKGKHYFPFNSLDSLTEKIGETGLLSNNFASSIFCSSFVSYFLLYTYSNYMAIAMM